MVRVSGPRRTVGPKPLGFKKSFSVSRTVRGTPRGGERVFVLAVVVTSSRAASGSTPHRPPPARMTKAEEAARNPRGCARASRTKRPRSPCRSWSVRAPPGPLAARVPSLTTTTRSARGSPRPPPSSQMPTASDADAREEPPPVPLRQVLIPVDGTPPSEYMLDWALKHFCREGDQVRAPRAPRTPRARADRTARRSHPPR